MKLTYQSTTLPLSHHGWMTTGENTIFLNFGWTIYYWVNMILVDMESAKKDHKSWVQRNSAHSVTYKCHGFPYETYDKLWELHLNIFLDICLVKKDKKRKRKDRRNYKAEMNWNSVEGPCVTLHTKKLKKEKEKRRKDLDGQRKCFR